MVITKISLNIATERNLLAYCNIVLDDVFIVRGIRIVSKPNGDRLVLMPSRQNNAGEFKDVCHPLTRDFRSKVESLILARLDALLSQGKA